MENEREEEGCKTDVVALTPAHNNSHSARSHGDGFGSWAWPRCCPQGSPCALQCHGFGAMRGNVFVQHG